MIRTVTPENRRRLAEWEAEHEVSAGLRQILDEAHAATSANILAPAMLTVKYSDKLQLGLQALAVVELRRIAEVLEKINDG